MKSNLMDELFQDLTPEEADIVFQGIDIEDYDIEKADKERVKAGVIEKLRDERSRKKRYIKKVSEYRAIIAAACIAFIIMSLLPENFLGITIGSIIPSNMYKQKSNIYTEDISVSGEILTNRIGMYKIYVRPLIQMDKKVIAAVTAVRMIDSTDDTVNIKLSPGKVISLKDENGAELEQEEESHGYDGKGNLASYEEKKVFSNPNGVAELNVFIMGEKVGTAVLEKRQANSIKDEPGSIIGNIKAKSYINCYQIEGKTYFHILASASAAGTFPAAINIAAEDITVKDSTGAVLPFEQTGYGIQGEYKLAREGVKPYTVNIGSIRIINSINRRVEIPLDTASTQRVSLETEAGRLEFAIPMVRKTEDGVSISLTEANSRIETISQWAVSTTQGVEAKIGQIFVPANDSKAFRKEGFIEIGLKDIITEERVNWAASVE
ncbi:MAG: hypothetical protein Q8930_07345 [Bacillota bacterium]|nr:hypothetical protein [Bacillota bacterium]